MGYKDLDLDFGRNAVTNDVNKLTDVEAVKEVLNLINTNHYEDFSSEIGSGIRGLLFELSVLLLLFKRKVEEVLLNFEQN